VNRISSVGFRGVGTDQEGDCRVMAESKHRLFVGTLFVPQAKSSLDLPHPMIIALLLAATR
jgi:CTP synthase (UTP-ammonia lyase)